MSRTVLVTGANSGIGFVTALDLAAHGWSVIGTARTQEKADLLLAAADERNLVMDTVLFDVTDEEACAQGVAEAQSRSGGLDALVNNAGGAQTGAVEDVTDQQARAQLELNLLAPMRLCRLVLPGMRERGGGRVVNVSSVAGRVTLPLAGWYSASKHGLEAVTNALRIEVAGMGVAVVLVEPGSFDTSIWAAGAEVMPEASHPSYARAYERSAMVTGNGRFFPDPIWVARTIRLALTSPAPLPRYLIGVDAVGGVMMEKLLPTRIGDGVKAVSTRLSLRNLLPW